MSEPVEPFHFWRNVTIGILLYVIVMSICLLTQ
jgi:hypothetical protein